MKGGSISHNSIGLFERALDKLRQDRINVRNLYNFIKHNRTLTPELREFYNRAVEMKQELERKQELLKVRGQGRGLSWGLAR